MKSKILKIFVFSILTTEFFYCSSKVNSDNPLQLLALAARAARVIADARDNVVLQGTVNGPGSIKNATVQVFPTPKNGQCAKDDGTINGTPIASTTSDDSGNYSIKYKKTGTTMCVVVTPTGTSQIQVFSPTTKANVPTSWSKGNLMAVINEPATTNAGFTVANKTVNVNPFTRMTARRFSALSAINPSSRGRVFFRVIPFAERSAYSERGGASNNDKVEFRNNTASTLLDKASADIENAFFPNRDKSTFSLESADPNSNAMKLKLGTIGITADKLGGAADGKVSSDDLENVINFMEEDFSDGRFDGKKVDEKGKIATMSSTDFGGVVASKQAADDFLKVSFKASQTEYDSYDPSLAASASDQLFCETDSLDAACSITVLPGSAPDIWIFNQEEDFIDIGDSYDHGSVGFGTGGTSSTRYYAIVNGGGSDLKLTLPFTLTGTQFTVVEQPDAVVAAGDATYFAVKFVPTSAASFTQTLTVNSNDTLYSPYSFSVLGTGVDLSANPQIYWPFTGNSNDESGNSRHATKLGSSTVPFLWYDYFDVLGLAYYFDWEDDHAMSNAYGTGLGTATTISAWVSPDDLTNCPCTIIARGGNADINLQFYDGGTITFTVDTGVADSLDYYIDDEYDYDDGWIHVVGVYSNASGKMQIYINGDLMEEQAKTGTLVTGSTPFYAGDDGTGTFFSGTMDDIRLYSRALTAAQIAALYNQD
jgi:Concanavalin A-like lectin/glucanases superfamily